MIINKNEIKITKLINALREFKEDSGVVQQQTKTTVENLLLCLKRDYPFITAKMDISTASTSDEITVLQPAYYGGKDDPYEPFKVIRAWNLNFFLGNVLKYIRRAGIKDDKIVAYRIAREYLTSEIEHLESGKE